MSQIQADIDLDILEHAANEIRVRRDDRERIEHERRDAVDLARRHAFERALMRVPEIRARAQRAEPVFRELVGSSEWRRLVRVASDLGREPAHGLVLPRLHLDAEQDCPWTAKHDDYEWILGQALVLQHHGGVRQYHFTRDAATFAGWAELAELDAPAAIASAELGATGVRSCLMPIEKAAIVVTCVERLVEFVEVGNMVSLAAEVLRERIARLAAT